jgi:hypothetical protein
LLIVLVAINFPFARDRTINDFGENFTDINLLENMRRPFELNICHCGLNGLGMSDMDVSFGTLKQ